MYMSIFANQGKDVLVGYNYMLRVEGIFDLPCKAVHSFTKENEFDFIQEGGINDYVHMLRKPISKPFSFTVERYVGSDPYPPLPLGAELILPVILMVAPFPNRFDISKRTFVFTGCTVMGKTFGELNAEKSELLTETIVIGFREMVEITIPVHIGEDGEKWGFDPNNPKNAKGIGKRSAVTEEATVPEQVGWFLDGTKRAKAFVPTETTTEGQDAEVKNGPRKWKMDGKGTASAKTETDTEPVQRGYLYETSTQSARQYQKDPVSKDDSTEDGAEDKNKPRKWTMDGKGTASAKTEKDTDPVQRGYLYETPTQSARQYQKDEVKKDTKQEEGAEGEVGKAEEKNGPRKWIFPKNKKDYKGGGEASAKQDPKLDTDPEKRKWTMDGKGKASAKTEEDTKAENRSWMKDGTQSAKKLPLDETAKEEETEEGTEAAEEKNGPRKWAISKDKKNYKGDGKASAKKGPDTDPVQRSWMKDGTQSAKKLPLDDTTKEEGTESAGAAEEKNGPRKWIFPKNKKDYKGGGKASAKQGPDTDPAQKKWSMKDKDKTSAKTEEATKAEGRKWSMDGSGEASAKTEEATKAEGRKWFMDGGGEPSAQTEEATKAEGRKWSIDGSGEPSAATEKATKAEGRKWSIDGKGETSAKTEKDSKAEGRKWSMDGKGDASAKTEKDSKADSRKWSIDGKGDASARTEKDTDAEIRQWMMSAGGTTSAKTEPSSKPEQRKWPSISSAKKYEG